MDDIKSIILFMRYYFYPTKSAFPNTSLAPVLIDFKFTHLIINTGEAEVSFSFEDGLQLVKSISNVVSRIAHKEFNDVIDLQLNHPNEFFVVYSSNKRKSTLKFYSLQIERNGEILSIRPVSKLKGIQSPILQILLNERGQMCNSFNEFVFNALEDLSVIKNRCVELDNESFLVLDYISWEKAKRIDIEFALKPNYRSRRNEHSFSVPKSAISRLQAVLSEMNVYP